MGFARNSAKDISLGLLGDWTGGASDGTTLWFVNRTTSIAHAYTASTQADDTAKNIDLGTGNWQGGTSDGTTLWFIDITNNRAVARNASTRALDATKNISLPTSNWGGACTDGTTIWFTSFKRW